jgi:hypothetical protein
MRHSGVLKRAAAVEMVEQISFMRLIPDDAVGLYRSEIQATHEI